MRSSGPIAFDGVHDLEFFNSCLRHLDRKKRSRFVLIEIGNGRDKRQVAFQRPFALRSR